MYANIRWANKKIEIKNVYTRRFFKINVSLLIVYMVVEFRMGVRRLKITFYKILLIGNKWMFFKTFF